MELERRQGPEKSTLSGVQPSELPDRKLAVGAMAGDKEREAGGGFRINL